MERSAFDAARREANRAIVPVAVAMIVIAALALYAACAGILWVWDSTLPDWAYAAVVQLAPSAIALMLVLAYLGGRTRVRRRILRNHEGESGYAILTEAVQRGALTRFNLALAVLAIVLFVACQLTLSYLTAGLDEGDDEPDDDPQHSATEARADLPASSPLRCAAAGARAGAGSG